MTVARRRRHLVPLVAALALAGGLATVGPASPTADAADVGPLRVVPIDTGGDNLLEIVDQTVDGDRVLVSSAIAGRWVGDAGSSGASGTTFGSFSADSVLSAAGSSVLDPNDSGDGGEVTELRTGETTTVAFDVLTGGDGRTVAVPPEPFRISGGDGGRIVAADIPPDGSNIRWIGIVVDVETDDLLTPGDDGISITGSNNSSIESISPDGDRILYREFSSVGAQPSAWVRWTRSTDERVVVEQPTEHQAGDGQWAASSDLRWVTFVVGDTLTLRDLQGGDVVVPVTYSELEPSDGLDYRLTDDGQIVFLRDAPTAGFPSDQPHLFVWTPGDTDPTQISLGVGGAVPTSFVEDVEVSDDGATVSFTSFADNLVDETDGLERRVFQVDIADRPESGAARLMDTRDGVGGSTFTPGVRRCVPVPQAAPGEFVVVNVTPVRGSARGFGVVHSSDVPAGGTANVNYEVGSIDPNVAVSQVGADGEICFTNSSAGSPSVDVIMDLLLIAPADAFGLPDPTGAVRIMDTRSGVGGARLDAGDVRCVPVSGAAPGEFVVVNVTPVRGSARGFGVVHSSDVPAGGTANVNYAVGSIDPNVAVSQVGADGEICFTNSSAGSPSVDVIIDQLLSAPAATFRPSSDSGAVRLVDTRDGGATGGALGPGDVRCVATGSGDGDRVVGGEFVVVNLTPVRATARGFGTLHSSDVAAGATSNVNYAVGSIDPNVAISAVGEDGRVCFTNATADDPTVDLIADQLLVASSAVFRVPTS